MLAEIRRKLTHLYTLVFGLFLLAFIGIVCAGLVWGTYAERTEEIKILATEIARGQRAEIVNHYQNAKSIPQELPVEDDYDISGQVFYYILDRKGQLIKADLPVPVLREAIYDQFLNWDPSKDTKITLVTLPTGGTATLVLAAHKVQQGENVLATVYVGRDITAYARVIMRSVLTLAGVALSFLILAAIIGYFLAGKVTIPIDQSIRRQKQFVADASHELRNPLSVLLTSIEGIEMDKDNILSPFSREIMRDAKDEFSRLKGMVNDLLTLARADTGDIKLRKEHFSLEMVVEQVMRSLKYAAERKEISIRVDLTRSIELNADPERIHQLLYILIDNAIKYSSPNSEVSVQLDRVQISETSKVRIIVADTGPGIPLDFQEKIFQRFFRIDEARSRDIEGSGLGLSIAQWIVDTHEGEIYVKSVQGKGSQFVVTIPSS
jgi:Osmosensitive K+ channel histidine kinase